MKTENNFTDTAETIKENVTNDIKWMQNANAKLVETQKQQLKNATDAFNRVLTSAPMDATGKFNNTLGVSGKLMTEVLQKNIESYSNLLKTTMKPLSEYSKYLDGEILSKEVKKQVEQLNKQFNDLTVLNQTNFDIMFKQFEMATKSFVPLAEQLKKEINITGGSTRDAFQSIMDSYSAFSTPAMETGKNTFERLNEQMMANANANIRFWYDMMHLNHLSTSSRNEQGKERTHENTSRANEKSKTMAH